MSDDLYRENQILRRKLRTFLTQARENEQKMRRFHEQELRLIGTASLSELIQRVLFNYRTAFKLDVVSLVLLDPEYEIQRILGEGGVPLAEMEQLLFQGDPDIFDSLFGLSTEPLLGPFRPQEQGFLFAEGTSEPRSVALLPLVRYGEMTGCLSLGSQEPGRYVAGSATDFLQRLATIVAICLENATNHERLKRVGLTDSLTGVNNRRFFDQRLKEEVARAARASKPLGCLFLDVDHFKSVNDRFGHQVGDKVLWEVAGLIREQLRAEDVLGRYGGEEFSALLINTQEDAALEIAERIRSVIESYGFDADGSGPLEVTISIGVAMLSGCGEESDITAMANALIDHADQAVYLAKREGRNRVVLAADFGVAHPETDLPG